MITIWQAGRRIALAALLLLLGAALGIGAAIARDAAAYAGRIYPGVSVGGIAVGGLTVQEALGALQPVVEHRLQAPFTVVLADRTATFTHAEVGLVGRAAEAVEEAYAAGRTGAWWDRLRSRVVLFRRGRAVPLRFTHDAGRLRRLLRGLAAELDAAPKDAAVAVRDGRVELLSPSRPGQTLDVEATVGRVIAALEARVTEVEAAVAVLEPGFTTEDAGELRALLASYTTKMAANVNRTHNINLASGFVRGTILPPGAVFSYNKVVGPRTIERGFREAPVLVDDELVPGDGGGICQVSSTLFNVALLADFKILTRVNHSRPVAYLPPGRDATVVYGQLDLLFRNTTGAHVLLWTEIQGHRLTISAYGTPAPDTSVAVEVADREVIPAPAETVTKRDPTLEAGRTRIREAAAGLRVKTYRVVRTGGAVVRRELIGTSYYRPVRRMIKVGTKVAGARQPRP